MKKKRPRLNDQQVAKKLQEKGQDNESIKNYLVYIRQLSEAQADKIIQEVTNL